MTNVFIHIGLHKTGTTSIQHNLSNNRNKLLRLGFSFPMRFGPERSIFGHHDLAWSVFRRQNYLPPLAANPDNFQRKRISRELKEEMNKAENIIISSEELDVLCDKEIQDFSELFGKNNIITVIYVRRNAEFLESAYKTTVVHSFYTKSPEEFVKTQRTRLDYYQLAKDWLSISSDIKIVSYDDPDTKNNSFESFIRTIGLNPMDFEYRGRINESYPAFICELARFMRAKKCDDILVNDWVKKIGSRLKSIPNQWCLPREVIDEEDRKYNKEIARMISDERISKCLIGEFSEISLRKNTTSIKSTADAILSIGSAV